MSEESDDAVWRRRALAVLVGLAVLSGVSAGVSSGASGASAVAGSGTAAAEGRGKARFVVSEAQFERMFPERDSFFTYDGLVEATRAYPEFARTGGKVVRRQEAAAFLANVSHETGGLFYVVAQDESTYPIFCDKTRPYGCPAGESAYYGRGAIMLSWNFNYKAAGDALGIDLLNDPGLVERDPKVAWMTALWYWNTQTGMGTLTGHEAMVEKKGFGETIRSLNGPECGGGKPEQVKHRVGLYRDFVRVLHAAPGRHVSC
ncbi:chitinase [Streptomyces sp. NPDC058257]|uniref:chitinase n=1 Tax=Streptomyces sp. NPDC058257 TaxID=3346409 RepID=UPI0036E94C94